MFIYFFLREKQHEWGRGRERGRPSIGSRFQAPSRQPRARCRAWTHKPWDHDLSWSQMLNQLSHPGAPGIHLLKKKVYLFILRESEHAHKWGRGREKGIHRIWSRLQAPSCQHRAQCKAWAHEPWDHDLSWSRTLNQLSQPGALATPYFKLMVSRLVAELSIFLWDYWP